MIGPLSVVSKLPTVFLLFTTLSGILQAKIHRCLREFDPSNCNALEEVWAFDVEGQKCIEMVYGGCGKPKHLSNRFESHDECTQSCVNLLGDSLALHSTQRSFPVTGNVKDSYSSFKTPVLGLGRRVSMTLPENVEVGSSSNDTTALENIRSVLNYLGQEMENQPQSNPQQNQQAQYRGESILTPFGRQTQPNYERSPGQLYDQQARMQPMYGGGLGPSMGQQSITGSGRRPLPYGMQAYTRQTQGYLGPQPSGSYAQSPVYGEQAPKNSFVGQGPLLINPPAPLLYGGTQALYSRDPGPFQAYPDVQNMLSGIPYWRARRTLRGDEGTNDRDLHGNN